MTKVIKLELDDEVYEPMADAALRSGQTPEEWATTQLRRCAPTKEEKSAAMARLLSHTVSVPEAVGADNERIDEDLAEEYGSTHEES